MYKKAYYKTQVCAVFSAGLQCACCNIHAVHTDCVFCSLHNCMLHVLRALPDRFEQKKGEKQRAVFSIELQCACCMQCARSLITELADHKERTAPSLQALVGADEADGAHNKENGVEHQAAQHNHQTHQKHCVGGENGKMCCPPDGFEPRGVGTKRWTTEPHM